MNLKVNPDFFPKLKKVHIGFLPHKVVKDSQSDQYGSVFVDFGQLRYGQDLEILLEFDCPIETGMTDFIKAEVTYETNNDLRSAKYEQI